MDRLPASEDDNVTIQAVEGSKGHGGYFGYSYFAEQTLKALEIDGGRLCCAEPRDCSGWLVTPRPAAVHLPVRRGAGTARSRGVRSLLSSIDEIVEAAGFIGLNDEQKTAREQFDTLIGG